MPGERDIARRRAPIFRMIKISLVERAPLPFVDRPGIAVAKTLEPGDIEAANLAPPSVEPHRHLAPFDRGHRAGRAVIESELLVGPGELNPIARGEDLPSVRHRQLMIRAELAPLPSHR